MAKFDFQRSLYAKLYNEKEGARIIKSILDDSDLLRTNYGWWKTQGHVASLPCATDNKGVAMFRVKARSLEAAPLMDLRAPLGEALQMDERGGSEYMATLPDLITRARQETAVERDYRIKQFELTGNNDPLLAYWVSMAQTLKDSMEASLTWMTGQIMTKGNIDYTKIGRGIRAALHEADIPKENFVKAGEKIWTDPECNILAQMAKIEDQFRNKWGYSGPMIWQMPRDMWLNTFLQNKFVKEFIKQYRTLNYIATPEGMNTTEYMFSQAKGDLDGLGVSPIEVVEEKERNDNGETNTFVNGWEQNVAVLRPAGDAVEFEYTDPLDKYMYDNYNNGDVTKVFGSVLGGLGTIVNETAKDGQYNKWATYGFMSAAPALIDFTNHVIVDTTQAG